MKTILAPIDFSPDSRFALRYASRLAEEIGGKVIALNVVECPFIYPAYASSLDEERLALEAQRKLYMACQSDAFRPENVETMVRLAVDNVSEEIDLAAREVAADLIVIPAHHRSGFGLSLFTPTADKIGMRAPCPVLMVPVPSSASGKSVEFSQLPCECS